MMKQEFIDLLNEKSGGDINTFPDEEFVVINTVYMYHPAMTDKKAMVDLFWQFGMTIIADMLPRAEKLAEIERKIQALNNAMNELRQEAAEASR